MKHIVSSALLLMACAVPAEQTTESAATGELEIHESTWFRISYHPALHAEAPLANCSGPVFLADAAPDPGCYTSIAGAFRPGVPDYIEDLGVFLDAALTAYQPTYNLPTSGRIDVMVRGVSGYGTVLPSGVIEIANRMKKPLQPAWTIGALLRYIAWHEVFHVAQSRAFEGPPPWQHFDIELRHRWLIEATATEIAFAAVPVAGRFLEADPRFLLTFPLVIEHWEQDTRAYAAFAFIRYLKHQGIDLTQRWFNEASPRFHLSTVSPTDPIEQFFFDELSAVVPGAEARRELFRRFALAYQFTRDDAIVPGIRSWLTAQEGLVHELTGYERVDPGPDDEPPLSIIRTVDGQTPAGTLLRPGAMATHAIGLRRVLCTETGPSCNPDAIPLPDQARLHVTVRVRPVVGGEGSGDGSGGVAHHGAAWRVSGSGQATLLETFAGAEEERELELPLSDFSRTDRLVVAVINDPEQSAAEAFVEVEAAFDGACRSKVIVVDHPQSQVGFYGGPGYLFDTEEGCTQMLVKIWGGGGPLRNWLLGPGIANGNGGGGAFVGARIPIDPEGEQLRATVPFAGITGTATFPAFIYQPAAPPQVPSVIALAGAGGQGGQGYGWTAAQPPHAGGAHQDAPAAIWTLNGSTVVMPGGTGASDAGPGVGGPHNTPYGDGRAFTTANILGYTWESGGHGPCQAGRGGAGWFGGGGGDSPPFEWTGGLCGYPNMKISSGGGGGSSHVIASRLGRPVVATKLGGALHVPGNAGDPDRMTPAPPTNTCQAGTPNAGDPGAGRIGTHTAWCDNPGRIVIKFGRAATKDTSVPAQ
jgi:hypothetical protein